MKAAALLLLLAAAPTPKQFNLVCSGDTDTIFIGGQTKEPYSRILRIDLAAGEWCSDDCGSVNKIERAEPSRLVLRDVTKDTPHNYWQEIETVDRTNGYHSIMTNNAPPGRVGRSTFSSGYCEVAPFTGFARGPTRF